jgi:hypothetical protein
MPRIAAALGLVLVAGVNPVPKAPEIVGAWRLVSMVRVDSAGREVPYWDDRPAGLIIYTADGHMAAQLYDTRRFRSGDRWDATSPEVARAVVAGSVAYFGTYLLDRAAGTVTHNVEGAMRPDWVGTALVRAFKFVTPNRLELRVISNAGQRTTTGSVLLWERIG